MEVTSLVVGGRGEKRGDHFISRGIVLLAAVCMHGTLLLVTFLD